jgi:murein DD-endopeptidase MepM/ murein hydrolase activator NlpD
MSPENGSERRKSKHFTFVVIPGVDSDKTRTFSVSPLSLIGAISASFLVIVILIFAAIIYTPIGSLLPIANPELEEQYTRQIVGIQQQINTLLDQMGVLRAYNLRLRKAMGEDIRGADSTLLAAYDETTLGKLKNRDVHDSIGEISEQQSVQHQMIPQAGIPENTTDGQVQFMPARRLLNVPMVTPFDGFVSRKFEPDQFHFGVDLVGKQGSMILAAADGNVIFAGWTYDDGMMIILSHDQGFLSTYKHNKALLKHAGSVVRRGEPVALLGNTGKTSSGPHLHFEIWKDGIAVDPMNYVLTTQ